MLTEDELLELERLFKRNVVGIYDSSGREMWPEFIGVVRTDYEAFRNVAPRLLEHVRELEGFLTTARTRLAEIEIARQKAEVRIAALDAQAKEDEAVFLHITRVHRKCCDVILRKADERLAARKKEGK